MKKFLTLMTVVAFVSCSGNDSGSTENSGSNVTNVENVNGTIPDTGNSTTINQPLPVDSVSDTTGR